MESVERIEVIKGPHSVLYGSQAIDGVINFITRKKSSDGASCSTHLKSIYNGATDGFTQLASVSGSVNQFEYRLSGNYSEHQNCKSPDGALDNTDFGNKSLSSWLGYTLDKHKLGLSLEHYQLHTQTYYDDPSSIFKDFSVRIPSLIRKK